jgi:hypothetical protein
MTIFVFVLWNRWILMKLKKGARDFDKFRGTKNGHVLSKLIIYGSNERRDYYRQ